MTHQSPYVFDLVTNVARAHYWPERGCVKVVWLDEEAVQPVAKPVRDMIEDAAQMGKPDEWCEDRRHEADAELAREDAEYDKGVVDGR